MTTPLTHFVQEMDPQGPGPTDEGFAAVWDALRALLATEMKRRNNWRAPPSYLGVVGHTSWTEPGEGSDALDELAAECFEFTFVRRLASLRAQAEVKPTVDGLVKLNIRHFLLETQQRNDPLGFRIYEVVQRTVLKLLAAERLFVLAGSEKVRNDTLLAVAASVPVEILRGVDPSPLADRWATDHLDPIVTASHRELGELLRTLGSELMAWLGSEAPGLRFGDLVSALRARVRSAWKERTLAAEPPGGPEPGGGARFQALAGCVQRAIAEGGGREKTRLYLEKLWRFLVAFATDGPDLVHEDLTNGDDLPPHRQLARLLKIPRDRIPGLLGTLGEHLRSCRQTIDSLEKGAKMASPRITPSPRERALASARAVHAREQRASQRPQAIRVGDVVGLPGATVPGVHWLLLAERPEGGFRAAPVDTFPFVGPRDVPLPERETQEPWVLRRELELAIPQDLVARATLLDQLAPEVLEASLRDPDLGSRQPVDAEHPAYREWMEEGPRAAYEELRRQPTPLPGRPSRASKTAVTPHNPFLWLAAVLALVGVGLGFHVGQLGTLIDELSEPIVNLPYREIQFYPGHRGDWTLEIPKEASYIQFGLVLPRQPKYSHYRFDLLRPDRSLLYRGPILERQPSYSIAFPARTLRHPHLYFRLYGYQEGEITLVDEQEIKVLDSP